MTFPPDPPRSTPSDGQSESLAETSSPPTPEEVSTEARSILSTSEARGRLLPVTALISTPETPTEGDYTDEIDSAQPLGSLLSPATSLTLVAVAVIFTGITLDSFWLTLGGSLVALIISFRLILPSLQEILSELSPQQQALLVAVPGALIGLWGLMRISGVTRAILTWGDTLRWDVIGALGDFLGAFGQIFIAMLALYVAWREYVISRDLTTQQNRITQQQTIDSYFQGISDLVLDEEGLLEDWPQERIIAEARTAAILSSIDAAGKAKIIRFLSRSRLLTPLRRDRRLGRPILDGTGGYEEDRKEGTRVINLGAMLAASDLSGSDLRWTDLSDCNLIRANLSQCDLIKANLSRTILYQADLTEADLMGTRLFYGRVETASPRSRTEPPDYTTGEHTGAVVEGADFSNVKRLSEEQRRYCCAWGGSATRMTIPGGCDDVPNRLER
ncbi:MAG TPA: pentapeptide repeat-containing protein [Leptolyngbyaceae cyanobacterium]